MKNRQKSFRVTTEAEAWLKMIADQEGTNQNAMIERLIRAEAKRRKLPKPVKEAGDE